MVGLTEAACSFLCDEAVVVRHDLRDHLDSGDGCGGDGGGGGGAATNMSPLLCPTEVGAGKQPVSVKNGPSSVRVLSFLL